MKLNSQIKPKDKLEEIFLKCKGMPGDLHFAFIDFNNFKQVNDVKGHITGDFTIKRVTDIILNNIRTFDILGRYGGDEFVIYFPSSNKDQVVKILDDIVNKVKECKQLQAQLGEVKDVFGLSIGCIKCKPQYDYDYQKAIVDSDAAMYLVKDSKTASVGYYDDVDELDINKVQEKKVFTIRESKKRIKFDKVFHSLSLCKKNYDENYLRKTLRKIWNDNFDTILDIDDDEILKKVDVIYELISKTQQGEDFLDVEPINSDDIIEKEKISKLTEQLSKLKDAQIQKVRIEKQIDNQKDRKKEILAEIKNDMEKMKTLALRVRKLQDVIKLMDEKIDQLENEKKAV